MVCIPLAHDLSHSNSTTASAITGSEPTILHIEGAIFAAMLCLGSVLGIVVGVVEAVVPF